MKYTTTIWVDKDDEYVIEFLVNGELDHRARSYRLEPMLLEIASWVMQ